MQNTRSPLRIWVSSVIKIQELGCIKVGLHLPRPTAMPWNVKLAPLPTKPNQPMALAAAAAGLASSLFLLFRPASDVCCFVFIFQRPIMFHFCLLVYLFVFTFFQRPVLFAVLFCFSCTIGTHLGNC